MQSWRSYPERGRWGWVRWEGREREKREKKGRKSDGWIGKIVR